MAISGLILTDGIMEYAKVPILAESWVAPEACIQTQKRRITGGKEMVGK